MKRGAKISKWQAVLRKSQILKNAKKAKMLRQKRGANSCWKLSEGRENGNFGDQREPVVPDDVHSRGGGRNYTFYLGGRKLLAEEIKTRRKTGRDREKKKKKKRGTICSREKEY